MPDVHASSDSVHGDDIGFRGGYGIPAVDAAAYWQSLVDYETRLQEYVEGAFVYQVGGFEDWASFEILGSEIEDWWLAYEGESQVRPLIELNEAQPTGGGETMAEYRFGIRAEYDRLKAMGLDVGAPLADEQAIHETPGGEQVAAYQRSTRPGLFWYDTASNTTVWLAGADPK